MNPRLSSQHQASWPVSALPFPPAVLRAGVRQAAVRRKRPYRYLLAARAAKWMIVGLALALSTPSLSAGLALDDFIQQIMLRGGSTVAGLSHHRLDLFAFANGNPADTHALMDEGVFPWWTDPHVRLSFFRPIASLTHYADHLWWPGHPLLMHLQSLGWFALLLVVVGAIYRRFFGPSWIAGLALLLYAVDDARAPVVGWIANRNALMAMAFSLPAVLAYDTWRRERKGWAAIAGPLALGAGLFAGEMAILTAAYLLSYAIFIDKGSRRARLFGLLPYAAVVLAWRVLYVRLGHGSVGSGLYFDPVRNPVAFFGAAATRFPALVLGQFALPWSDLWDLGPLLVPGARYVLLALAVGTLIGMAALMAPLVRRNPVARFWAFGCGLSLLLMCSTFPQDRLLTGAGVGGMGVLAQLLAAVKLGTYPRQRGWVTAAAGVLVAIHLAIAPVLAPYRAGAISAINGILNRAYESIPNDEAIAAKTVVLINPPLDPFAAYLPIYREAAHQRRPRRVLWLATGVSALRIERVDARTVRVRPQKGFLSSSSQMMLRSPAALSMHVGDRVALSDATFEVSQVDSDGRATEVLVRFGVAADDASLEWMQWGSHGYVPFSLPGRGESVAVPAVDLREAIGG